MKFYICVCGICIGWLIGMSSSPVISGVITSILALLITATSIIGGLSTNQSANPFLNALQKNNLNLLPVVILIVSLTAGSALGIISRTSNILNFSNQENTDLTIQKEINTYLKYHLDTQYIVKKVFDSKYSSNKIESQNKLLDGTLHVFTFDTSECKELCAKDTNDIIRAIQRSTNPQINSLDTIHDKSKIIKLIHDICKCE